MIEASAAYTNNYLVIADDRIGGDKQCFYCGQPVGYQHAMGCVQRQKRVWVKLEIEMEIERPEDWDADSVEFHLNESSWCSDNIVGELEEFIQRLDAEGKCLCEHMKASCLRDNKA